MNQRYYYYWLLYIVYIVYRLYRCVCHCASNWHYAAGFRRNVIRSDAGGQFSWSSEPIETDSATHTNGGCLVSPKATHAERSNLLVMTTHTSHVVQKLNAALCTKLQLASVVRASDLYQCQPAGITEGQTFNSRRGGRRSVLSSYHWRRQPCMELGVC